MQSFILIGYRCSGKTAVGKRLASRLGYPIIDSDTEIERRSGKTIAEIFSQQSEPVFRNLEKSMIAEILSRQIPCVLSTGGGAVLHADTRTRLRQSGRVIWLTAQPETILERMQNDAATETMRPSLTSLPMYEEIVAVLEKRIPLYQETAHEIIETDIQTAEQIADKIISRAGIY